MSPHLASRPRRLSRRRLLCAVPAAVGLVAVGGIRSVFGRSESTESSDNRDAGSPSEGPYPPTLRLPAFTSSGAKVPLAVEMSHPMDPGHYVTSLSVVNERDPVPLKGVFHFTPLNGQVYVAFQIRLDHGASEVAATAECSRHARWQTARAITIRSEEHTSELQSRVDLVCRLLLEKKKRT